MKPNTTLWPLDPHTKGKHLVLRFYLDAWLPIMSASNSRIVFIDGFAGPGEYEGGEEGSPIIALRAICEHRARNRLSAEIVFLFIEKEDDRVQHLQNLIDKRKPSLPSNCRVNVIHGTFDQTLTQAFTQLDSQRAHLAPALVMVDPFGISGTPMSVIKQILSNPKSEVYISFMYEWISRFRETPNFEKHLNDLYGCNDWIEGIDITDPEERKTFFYSLYEKRLREAGAKYVLEFELYEGKRLVYAIFFGTQDLKGCDRMKQAIWKIAPWGDFAFCGTTSPQLVMNIAAPDFKPLKKALLQEFRNKGWIPIKDIENFVASDKTDYHIGHIRKQALVPMEKAEEIQIDETTRTRKCTYPEGTKVRFL